MPPFKPGVSPNPGGLTLRGARARTLYDGIAADLGGDLSAIEAAQLGEAVRLQIKAERTADATASVRLSNASTRILERLKRRSRERQSGPTLGDILKAGAHV
jgi:hypothetical protein